MAKVKKQQLTTTDIEIIKKPTKNTKNSLQDEKTVLVLEVMALDKTDPVRISKIQRIKEIRNILGIQDHNTASLEEIEKAVEVAKKTRGRKKKEK